MGDMLQHCQKNVHKTPLAFLAQVYCEVAERLVMIYAEI